MAAISAEILNGLVGKRVKLTRKPKMGTMSLRAIDTFGHGVIVSAKGRAFYLEDKFGAISKWYIGEWDFVQEEKRCKTTGKGK